jgi:hypothetical protein
MELIGGWISSEAHRGHGTGIVEEQSVAGINLEFVDLFLGIWFDSWTEFCT